MKCVILYVIVCFCLFSTLTIISDFSEYQQILEGNYNTPWYSDSWVVQPYTNFRLSQYTSKIEVKTNACGSEIWIVKTTKINNKEFWTTKQRIPITP